MNNFIMYEQYVIINCPTCKIAISDRIPLVTDENKGFADSEFMAKKNINKSLLILQIVIVLISNILPMIN